MTIFTLYRGPSSYFHKILRLITGSQAKVPIEMLYLETAQLPLKYVMSVKRILYLHNKKNHKTTFPGNEGGSIDR